MCVVGFVGLGAMGGAIARHLVPWPGGLIVHDVRAEAAVPLAERGATVAPDLAAVAAVADVISVMVVDDEQVREVVAALLPHARPGAVVALHSTIRGATAVDLAREAAGCGVSVVDAPVSGGVVGAHAGRLAVMVGGAEEAFERCREPFGRFAEVVVHCGPVGSATRTKLARNVVNFVGIAAALEAARLAEAAGVELRTLGRVTTHSDGLTGGPGAVLVRDSTATLAGGDPLRAVFEHTRDLGEKDLALALELADEVGADTPLARVALERLAGYLGVPREDGR